jgi:hypothetical protein
MTEQISTTRLLLQDLVEGQDYFVALTATNTSARTSALSAETSDFPAYGPGLRAPDFIADLTVRPQGADLVLEWSEVTTDCYGKPAEAALYEIFRAGGTDYSNAALAKIDECAAPCTSWTDTDAFSAPGGYHYRVRAVDAESNTGGLGSELPEGVFLGLVKSETIPGALVLTWSAAQQDLDGRPAQLSHYAVYGSDQPFSREEIRDGQLAPIVTVPAPDTSFELTPPSQNRYYSVLAVDIRGNVSPY